MIVTHSSNTEGSGANAVDRFVDRPICATSALRVIGGTAHPEVPWRVITDMRNRVTHGYFDIDLDIV